jgi:predicted metal-binding membrane protein
MDAGSPARYAVEIVIFLIGWSAVAAAIFIPASLARRNALDIRREFIFAGYCFIAWLLFGAVSLCGDLLLHMVVRAQSWLAANTWLLTAAPLGAAGTFELTEFKRKMLYAWSAGRTNADLPATSRALRSGYGGLGPFGPILLVIFALGESSLAWAIALGAVIVTQTRFPAMRPLQVLVGLSLLIAAAIATLSGASVVCAHDGVACGAG